MNQPSGNKRKHRRFTVDVTAVQGNAFFDSEVIINDVSVTGVSFQTDKRPEQGQEYYLRIVDDQADMGLRGRVIWVLETRADAVHEGEQQLSYTAGMQFIDLQQESLAHLISFIETHLIERHTLMKFHAMSGCRCNIRFHVDRNEKASLNLPESYRVREISLGGMLMESHHRVEPGSVLHLDMTIPPDLHLNFSGRAVSCVPSGDQVDPRFDVGISFTDLPEPDRAGLKDFIRRRYLEDAGF
ncbi:MAG: hypothetical protein EPN25_08525 [Nitrospirae bacterium]|nr:MAG: hypothetical protein EPN25_08525 [Nitrospirota bacterium]